MSPKTPPIGFAIATPKAETLAHGLVRPALQVESPPPSTSPSPLRIVFHLVYILEVFIFRWWGGLLGGADYLSSVRLEVYRGGAQFKGLGFR